jgi:hypothetical protein
MDGASPAEHAGDVRRIDSWFVAFDDGWWTVFHRGTWGRPSRRPSIHADWIVRLLIVVGLLLVASSFVPVVRTAGVCAFLPCDPGPKDAAVGFAADGTTPVVAVSPCGLGAYTKVQLRTADEQHTVLWSAERFGPGEVQVLDVLHPPGQFRVTQPLASQLPNRVDIEVAYPRGLATSDGDLSGVQPGKFALFRSGGSSLEAFNAQADAGGVCRWYASPLSRWWPLVAIAGGAALILSGLLRRRLCARSFRDHVRQAFGDRASGV